MTTRPEQNRSRSNRRGKLYGRPIVAVDPWAQKRAASVVADAADKAVGWNKQSIINAVWRLGNRS